MNSRPSFVTAFLVLAGASLSSTIGQERKVVAYVSLDEEHSRTILEAFTAKSGIKVVSQFDTEDNKTVGMVNRIIAEKSSPLADVYWNNECGQSERLKSLELLQPYLSPAAAGLPKGFVEKDGHWTGFAARARVLIWNPQLIAEKDLPKRLEDLADPKFRGQLAMARPLTGTTLTHLGALYAVWGATKTDAWLDRLQKNDVRFERGNAQVAQLVAEGTKPFGLTDTDDVHVRRLDGLPVKEIALDQEPNGLGTLIIPNSVMILKGAPHLAEAKALVDYLISAEVETKLAEGRSAQIPLRPGVTAPPHVQALMAMRPMAVDFAAVGSMITSKKLDLEKLFLDSSGVGLDKKKSSTALVFALVALALALVFVSAALRTRSKSQGSA